MRRNLLFLLLCLLNFEVGFSQEVINDLSTEKSRAIHQIATSGFENILNFQSLNQGTSNFVLTQQIGDQNKANVKQQNNTGASLTNQSYTIQQGNANELTVGQIGSGNLLLSFQLGYLANKAGINKNSPANFGIENFVGNAPSFGSSTETNETLGERNKLEVSQDGENNGILTVQQGDDNLINAEQKGSNNYLVVIQNGKNNSVTGYKQENSSEKILFDTVIQKGENLSLDASDASKSKPNGNLFSQSGSNLSLQVNNGFINSLGGIEIAQTGKDMKVVVDQSYFAFPTK